MHKWLAKEELQLINERQFNRKHIDGYIRADLFEGTENINAEVNQGVELLQLWLDEDYFDSKAVRLSHVKHLDLKKLVQEIFVGICYLGNDPTPMINVIGQLASRLGFDDKRDSIQTVAEILAVLCETDLFDITKAHKQASLQIVNRIGLPQEIMDFIERSCFLPPLVCEPRELTHNMSSAYYTHEADSLILGGAMNHHDGNICLDVLNKRNKVPLSLDVEFLCNYEEEPTYDLNTVSQETLDKYEARGRKLSHWDQADLIRKQKQNWDRYKRQSYYFYSLIVNQGNKYYVPNKFDKRGRMYSSGYHINPMGTPFKKAMTNFANKEQVSGVPEHLKIKD